MPQIYNITPEERTAYLAEFEEPPTTFDPEPLITPTVSVSTSRRLNVLYTGHTPFSFIPSLFLSSIPRAYLASSSPFQFIWSSHDFCQQVMHPIDSFHYSPDSPCSPDEVALGIRDTMFNLHSYIQNTPNNPALIGFAYTGLTSLHFTVPFSYSTPSLSRSSDSCVVYRRDHRTTVDEVKTYLEQRYEHGYSDDYPLDAIPERYRTDNEPMTPRTWHEFMEPFTVTSGDEYVFRHRETFYPIAFHYAPQLFKSIVEAYVAINGFDALDRITAVELARYVQEEAKQYFIDGQIYAEYFLKFKSLYFTDIPSRIRPDNSPLSIVLHSDAF
ncbi:hypothetical protein AAF712_016348 [Marasmius tenuissimus]|uniref:Uncharacterized protein n=1 Tax=Marasmius tenuissimus TaxID=585030 RepID=A0ABR2Z853_9AGAR